eukprot:403372752
MNDFSNTYLVNDDGVKISTTQQNSSPYIDPNLPSKFTLTEAQIRQKKKLEQQFSVVTPLIIVFVKQMFIMFFLKVVLYGIEENGMSYNEKTLAYFLMAMYYILYFNSMYKFAMSFYNIMRNSQIDESDIMIMEVYATFAFGAIYLFYGILYSTVYLTEGNTYYGNICCGIGISIFIQCYLLKKYYMSSHEAFEANSDKKQQ